MWDYPHNFKLGRGSLVGGSHFRCHSSLKTPVIFEMNPNTNRIRSPGFITFYS